MDDILLSLTSLLKINEMPTEDVGVLLLALFIWAGL